MRILSKIFLSFDVFFFFCADDLFIAIFFANDVGEDKHRLFIQITGRIKRIRGVENLVNKNTSTSSYSKRNQKYQYHPHQNHKNSTQKRSARRFEHRRQDVLSSIVIFCLTPFLINGSIYKRIQ